LKHRKTPRWVDAAISTPPPQPAQKRSWLILSDLVGRLEVECVQCKRRGRYRVDRLLAEHGDLPLIEIMRAIAANVGCASAQHPLGPYDAGYATGRCRIRRVL
jgi:hypothetical protein